MITKLAIWFASSVCIVCVMLAVYLAATGSGEGAIWSALTAIWFAFRAAVSTRDLNQWRANNERYWKPTYRL
jgi:uncharacterized membrane protein